jgi:hypothetical protein
MLRNPLEVTQGVKDPFRVLLWVVPENVATNPYFISITLLRSTMIVVSRNFGVALFCMEGGKKCHQAKSL